MKKTELIVKIFEILKKDKTSEILVDLLETNKNSFELKSLTAAEYKFINNLEKDNDKDIFSYFFYESKHNELLVFIEEKDIDEKLLIVNIINVLEFLNKEEYRIGKIISKLLTENVDDNSFQSFLPLNNIINEIIDLLEKEMYLDLHKDIPKEVLKDYGGWFYWYCIENNFGKKKLAVTIDKNEYIMDSINIFMDKIIFK